MTFGILDVFRRSRNAAIGPVLIGALRSFQHRARRGKSCSATNLRPERPFLRRAGTAHSGSRMLVVTIVYVLGLLGFGALAAHGAIESDWAFAVGFGIVTLLWAFGYFLIVTPIRLVIEVRRLWRQVREEYRRTGRVTLDPRGRAFLIEQAAEAASRHTPLPSFVLEWIATRVLARYEAKLAADSSEPEA